MATKKTVNKNAIKITITWDGIEGEGQNFKLVFSPDPLKTTTDVRKQLVVLANAFAKGTEQLMSVIKPLPQPTEEELKNAEYDFAEHGKEFGEGLFGLYNYKKAIMEEFVSIVGRVLPDAFHDVLYVKGAQEKIFDTLRKEHAAKREMEAEEATSDAEVDCDYTDKGVVN
jgi:hypothetical protein